MAKTKNLFGEDEPPVYSENRLSERGKQFLIQLEAQTVDILKGVYLASAGTKADPKMRKRDLCVAIAGIFDFKTQAEFDEFFKGLPPLTQEAIRIGVFHRYVPTAPLEKKYRSPILGEKRGWGYERVIELNDGLRLDYFSPADPQAIYLPEAFRNIFRPWLPPPPGLDPVPVPKPEGQVWSNVEFIREAAPLMGRLAVEVIGDRYRDEFARKGLSKTDAKKFRATCGLPEFPMAGKHGLDSLDLFVRVAACADGWANGRVKDGDEYLRKAIHAFLNPTSKTTSYMKFDGSAVEYLCLIDHLSRRQGYYVDLGNAVPLSRRVFARLLEELGKTSAWYATADLYRALIMREEKFYFIDPYEERVGLLLRCTSLTSDGVCFTDEEQYQEIPMTGRIREAALGLPLLKAYCYVMALLGVVEIAETEPELAVVKKEKKIPVSPYDAAAYVRVTEFGSWCLGLITDKPKQADLSYEAIADKELLLVTFRGKSIERKLFLENIGERLGAERFRVTEASFIRGCEVAKDIDLRIETFKRIIDPTPSPRWIEFFESVRERAGLFTKGTPALVFTLPADPALSRAIVSCPILRPFIVRAEGGKIVVLAAAERKFRKALAEAGFFNEE